MIEFFKLEIFSKQDLCILVIQTYKKFIFFNLSTNFYH